MATSPTNKVNEEDESYAMSTFGKQKKGDQDHLLQNNGTRSRTPAPNGKPQSHSTPINRNHLEGGATDEKARFLSPVSLEPAWESQNQPDDVLNFSNVKKNDDTAKHAPIDRLHMVHAIMLIFGVATLMPWNMFITAKAYFEDYKLSGNSTGSSEYRQQFLNYLGITANIPNVALSLINMCCHCGGGQSSKRIVWSIVVVLAVFILTIILAMIDSRDWPGLFFWITMASVVVLNMANGVFQNCVYGLAAILPMKYTNAVILGSNLSGIFTSVINIIAIAAAPNLRTSAIYYFITAVAVLLVAFDCYFVLPLLKFYKHHQRVVEVKAEMTRQVSGVRRPPYILIFKKIWVQLFSVFFVFFVTLTIFPAIQSNVKRVDLNFSDTYWVPVFCFLNFNFFAMLGNLVSEWIKFPGPRYVWIPILVRGLLFVPFFILCNYRPDVRMTDKIPIWFGNDYLYIFGSSIMAFTSGYFSSLAMMYGPSLVDPEYAATAGMMMAFALISGVFGGVNSSLAIVKIVQVFGECPPDDLTNCLPN